jgi:hypothetical protein
MLFAPPASLAKPYRRFWPIYYKHRWWNGDITPTIAQFSDLPTIRDLSGSDSNRTALGGQQPIKPSKVYSPPPVLNHHQVAGFLVLLREE